MWVVMNDSFVSIVEHWDNAARLVVRGRFAGDVARFLEVDPAREEVTPGRDYRYRIVAPRRDVIAALKRAVLSIDYGNFKDSIRDGFRRSPAIRTWAAWADAQHDHLMGSGDSPRMPWAAENSPGAWHDSLDRDNDEPYEPEADEERA